MAPAVEECCSPSPPKKPPELWNAVQAAARPAGMGLEHGPVLPFLPLPLSCSLPMQPSGMDNMAATCPDPKAWEAVRRKSGLEELMSVARLRIVAGFQYSQTLQKPTSLICTSSRDEKPCLHQCDGKNVSLPKSNYRNYIIKQSFSTVTFHLNEIRFQ